MADDDIFGGDESFDSDDFAEFGDLDETPDFDLGDMELGLADDDDILLQEFGEEEAGISRTFKLAVGVVAVIVVIIVLLLVVFALSGGDELTAGEKTATAAVETNVAIENEYNMTLTALAILDAATQTEVKNREATVTAISIAQRTEEAQATLDAADTATAEVEAEATAAAQTATAEASAVSAQMTAESANRIAGVVIAEGNVALSGATLRLWRDDGDGEFNPGGETPAPTDDTGDTGDAASEAQPISYSDVVSGVLARGETAEWTFTGSAGDTVLINAIASDPIQMDMFLHLLDSNGIELTFDDDSGDQSNAAIQNFPLPASGQYTIQVSSVAEGGEYTLSLSLGLTLPGDTDTDADEVAPAEESAPGDDAEATPDEISAKESELVLARAQAPAASSGILRQDATPTPAISGDELIDSLTTGPGGEFDFGSLEPGEYWLELDYDSLTPDLQALVSPGAILTIKVTVPTGGGEIRFEIVETPPTPTPTGQISDFDQTATAFAARMTPIGPLETPGGTLPTGQIFSPTPTEEPGAGTVLPDTGIFDEIGDGGSDLDGTSGLTVLAIAAAGLIAVVFIARKLRASS